MLFFIHLVVKLCTICYTPGKFSTRSGYKDTKMHCKIVNLECGRYCRRYDGTLYYDYHDVTNGVRQSPYTGDDGVYSTTAFTNRAVELINDHDRTTSMFMYLSYQAPHTPIQVNCCQICCSLSQKNCP